MPSPPPAVSSSHQAVPAATDVGSVVSTSRRRVASEELRVCVDETVSVRQMPGMGLLGEGVSFGGEHLEGRDPNTVEPARFPSSSGGMRR